MTDFLSVDLRVALNIHLCHAGCHARVTPDQPGASFRKSVNARINAAEKVASALEQELTRRFPEHLRWNRMGGPSIKTMANRVTYVTGEILRQFEKPV